jgi:phage baseplate assembly protein W
VSPFERQRPRVRRAETQVGDSLQRVAARELGDATRWPLLATLNNLVPPYITDDPGAVTDRVILSGTALLVPDSGRTAQAQPAPDPARTFGVDVSNRGGGMAADDDGDLRIVSGYANFTQALSNRLETNLRELLFHSSYGNGARDLIGRSGNSSNRFLAASLVKRAIVGDDRVERVRNIVAVAIDGANVPVESAGGI